MSLPRIPKPDVAAIVDEHESVTHDKTPLIDQLSNTNSAKASIAQTVNAYEIKVPFTALLDNLDAADRDLAIMYHVEGMSLADIARTLGAQESEVHKQLEATNKTLREAMTQIPKVHAVSPQEIPAADSDSDGEPTPEIRALFQCAERSTEMSVRKFQELAAKIARIPLAPATETPRKEDEGNLVGKDLIANSGLTRRQQEIARMLVETGLSLKEMAAALNISYCTIRKHVNNIYRLLKVHSRSELLICLQRDHHSSRKEDGPQSFVVVA